VGGSEIVSSFRRFTVPVTVLALALTAQSAPVKVINEHELPPLSYVDLGYSQEEVDYAAANGLTFTDRPAIASGLQHLKGNQFLSVTDRGPTYTVPAG